MSIYLNRFLKSRSAENIIGLFSCCNNPAKEITESWAMLEALKKHVPDYNDRTLIVVGDGRTPRTGVILAYFTLAEVITVDPNFDMLFWQEHTEQQKRLGFPPSRIGVHPCRVEDRHFDIKTKTVVIWPHSHADMNALRLSGSYSRVDIDMPCCKPIPKEWGSIPHVTYDDHNVLSPKRSVHIWESLA